ncbi:MAG: LTA synthase family protein [Bacteroidetes bacterium]|nr:LTA synthase family protein [Bacteroidota bacterium]
MSAEGWLHWVKTLVFWLFMAWLSRLVFLGRSWDVYRHYEIWALLSAFWAGSSLDLSTACYLTVLQMLLCIPLAFAPGTRAYIRTWLLVQTILLSAAYFILCLTDSELLRKWGNRINDQVFIYLEHPREVMAFSSGTPWTAIFCWFLAAMLPAIWIYGRLKRMRFFMLKPAPWNNLSVRYGLLLLLFPLGMRGGVGTVPLNQSASAFSNETQLNILAVNTFWNFGYYLSNGTRTINFSQFYCCSEAEEQRAISFLYPRDSVRKVLCHTVRPNVLLIILEGITAKASQRLSGTLNCTPNLDRIAAEGFSFRQAYAAGDRTDKGLATLLSSWVPQPWHSVLHEPEKAARMPSLTATLAAAGYQTLFTYGGDIRFADMKAYLMASSFRELYDQADYPASQQNSKWGAHDEYVYQKLLEQLRGRSKPWFGALLSLSSHEPFEVPGGSLKGTETEKFRASIQYADRCLGAFMEQAKKEPWYRETLIVITADHGHDIGLNPGHSFHPDLFHIPMVFTGGALNEALRGTENTETISQAHLASNLLIQMGMKPLPLPYSTWFDGNSDYAYYAFNSGFGVVRDSLSMVGENQPLRRTFLKGSTPGHQLDSMILTLSAAQQFWIKKYRDL